MTKQKGTYYENRLIKMFSALGYEAWKVPLSGAIGENPACILPDRVRKYLIGDVCVNILGSDYPFEVKFRSGAAGFQQLYTSIIITKSYRVYRTTSKTSYYVFDEIDDYISYRLGNKLHPLISNNKFPKQVIDWMDHVDSIALKAKDLPWLFVIKKEI